MSLKLQLSRNKRQSDLHCARDAKRSLEEINTMEEMRPSIQGTQTTALKGS